jgi:hypothetical protein
VTLDMWCNSDFTQIDGNWNVLHHFGDWDPMLNHTENTTAWSIFHFASGNKPWLAGATFYNQAVMGLWEQHAQDYWGDPFVGDYRVEDNGGDGGWMNMAAFSLDGAAGGSAVLIALGRDTRITRYRAPRHRHAF